MIAEHTVTELLDEIIDPFLGLKAKEMNLNYVIQSNAEILSININAGFPCAFLDDEYKIKAMTCLKKHFPHHAITINFTHFIKAHQTQLLGKGLRGVKNTIAVASGKGGVGKSTVTVNLAIAIARQGARVGVLDADIYGPSIPIMLGHPDPVQCYNDRYLPLKVHGIQAMSIGYLTQSEHALIWRGPMLAKSLIQMLDLTLWDELDYLFIDLPPGTGDIQLTLVQKIPLTAAIVVTTPQQVATLDAQKALSMFAKTNIDVLGVIENMAMHRCSQCSHEEAIFGEGGAAVLCSTQQTQLLGQLPLHSNIRAQCDQGIPTAVLSTSDPLSKNFHRIALRSMIELAKKRPNYGHKLPPVVVE